MNHHEEQHLDHLVKALESLRQKVQIYQEDIAMLEQMVERHGQLGREALGSGQPIVKISPMNAAIALFDAHPDQKFTAADLKDHLDSLRQEKRLRSKSNNLRFAANDIVRRLSLPEKEFLRKEVSGKNVTYQRTKKR